MNGPVLSGPHHAIDSPFTQPGAWPVAGVGTRLDEVFRVGSNLLIFRGGDLHLSGGSAYTVLKRE